MYVLRLTVWLPVWVIFIVFEVQHNVQEFCDNEVGFDGDVQAV